MAKLQSKLDIDNIIESAGKIDTFRKLRDFLNEHLTDEQLDADIIAEDSTEGECYPAEFRIAGENNDMLDENSPVIYF